MYIYMSVERDIFIYKYIQIKEPPQLDRNRQRNLNLCNWTATARQRQKMQLQFTSWAALHRSSTALGGSWTALGAFRRQLGGSSAALGGSRRFWDSRLSTVWNIVFRVQLICRGENRRAAKSHLLRLLTLWWLAHLVCTSDVFRSTHRYRDILLVQHSLKHRSDHRDRANYVLQRAWGAQDTLYVSVVVLVVVVVLLVVSLSKDL